MKPIFGILAKAGERWYVGEIVVHRSATFNVEMSNKDKVPEKWRSGSYYTLLTAEFLGLCQEGDEVVYDESKLAIYKE